MTAMVLVLLIIPSRTRPGRVVSPSPEIAVDDAAIGIGNGGAGPTGGKHSQCRT
jgi:hypothetical protein